VREFLRENPFEPPGGTVFVGDSITEGFDLAHHFPAVDAINRGIGGDNVTGVCERFWLSGPSMAPRKFFLMIGINDILGSELSLEQMKFVLFSMLAMVRGHLPSTEVHVQSILPVRGPWAAKTQVILGSNQALKDLCGYFHLNFVDLFPLFAEPDNHIKPAFTSDDLHLSDQGYEVWANAIRPLVEG
jgi:lysophospholipase L1-like esterase